MNSEQRKKYVEKVAVRWGRNCIWATGSKVKLIYKTKEAETALSEIIKNNEAIVLISNHQSNLDIQTLLGYFPKSLAFIAKKEMEKWPLIGRWMRAMGCIFLDRKNARQGMKDMKNAMDKIKKGYSYVIFPEGGRTPDGEVKDFKKGSFRLATETGAKILPVTIRGTYNIQKKGSLKVTANKNVKIIVDEPVDLSKLTRPEIKELDNKVRDIIINNLKESME
jgi:1-acyl-sn-glycerol-3-phosphate acyltransferase